MSLVAGVIVPRLLGGTMSFDLTFWYESEPSSPERAAQIYDQLADEELGIVERNHALDEFYQEVISVYEDITEENAEESPWTSPVYHNDECVIANIAWSRHKEVGPALIAMAARHGLTSYDPQDRVVHYPSGSSAQ
jgi:hypothetical protein